MPFIPKFAEFSPGEVSSIAGIHPDTLRTWRKRGAIDQGRGLRPRFTCFELAAIMIQHNALAVGMPLLNTPDLAREHARTVIYVALNEGKACEIRGPEKETEEKRREIGNSHHFYSETVGLGGETPHLVLLVPNGEAPVALYELAAAELAGIASGYFINLLEIGTQLASRIQRPLLTLTWEDEPSAGSRETVVRV